MTGCAVLDPVVCTDQSGEQSALPTRSWDQGRLAASPLMGCRCKKGSGLADAPTYRVRFGSLQRTQLVSRHRRRTCKTRWPSPTTAIRRRLRRRDCISGYASTASSESTSPRRQLLPLRGPSLRSATTPRAGSGSPTRKARRSGARTTAPSSDGGNPLYSARSVRVVCLDRTAS